MKLVSFFSGISIFNKVSEYELVWWSLAGTLPFGVFDKTSKQALTVLRVISIWQAKIFIQSLFYCYLSINKVSVKKKNYLQFHGLCGFFCLHFF